MAGRRSDRVAPGLDAEGGADQASRVVDPYIPGGSGHYGRIRAFRSDLGIPVGSGHYGRILAFRSDPGILVRYGYSGWIWAF